MIWFDSNEMYHNKLKNNEKNTKQQTQNLMDTSNFNDCIREVHLALMG